MKGFRCLRVLIIGCSDKMSIGITDYFAQKKALLKGLGVLLF